MGPDAPYLTITADEYGLGLSAKTALEKKFEMELASVQFQREELERQLQFAKEIQRKELALTASIGDTHQRKYGVTPNESNGQVNVATPVTALRAPDDDVTDNSSEEEMEIPTGAAYGVEIDDRIKELTQLTLEPKGM